LEPDNKPSCTGPELFSHESARTTIFKRRLGRIYFQTSNRHIALIDGRLFCSRDPQALNRIVDLVNKYPRASGKIRNVMQVPLDDSILWAGKTRDVCGLAVGDDGLVVLHHDSAEGVSIDGRSLWTAQLPTTPVRWGAALTGKECVVTLSDGFVVCLVKDSEKR
ncbi:MAG: hypothetical protein ACYS80_19300, partial [Planctomycetota bacterium]